MAASVKQLPDGTPAREEICTIFARALMRHLHAEGEVKAQCEKDAKSSQNPLGSCAKQSVYPLHHE